MKSASLLVVVLLASACASVPHDAGVSDVRQAVSARTNQNVEFRAEPSSGDDPRVRDLLSGELTADKAVAVAMVNNPRLQATLAELGIARAELLQATVIRNPLFEAEIRFPRDPFRPFELRLAQTLVDLIQLPRRKALGRAAFDAATLRVTAEVVRFAGEVRGQHADLLAASQRVALSRENLEAAKASAELAQRQHDAQNITDLELENEQAQYEQAKLDLAREEQRLLVAREVLLRAMGLRDASTAWQLPAAFPPLPASEQDQQTLEHLAANRRLDIEIARRELAVARQQIPMARLAALGDITVDGHLQRDASGAKTFGPGIELPVPIFNNGAPARSHAEAEYVRAAHTLNALLAESASRLREARSVVAEARARVEYFRDVIVPRRERIVRLTTLEHNAMLVGVFQLLQAKESETRARLDYIDAQHDYASARNALDRALNGVDGDEMTRVPAADSSSGKHTSTTSPEGGH
ncbi:MAG: outer membrane protein heavy metal efflux system [Thermoanaerobaculia bacterium]|jgi:cobalt-zinc-cadmium efflux system outer membrane protein|nr:outer membrane protein heavy metal efflux system [Thermoanaerobaculia bacterium]